jgi:signal transduction histidine kinase
LKTRPAKRLAGAPTPGVQRIAEFSVSLAKGGPVAQSALDRRPAFVGRERQPLGLAEEQLLRMLGSESMVVVPLVVGARCLGVLVGGVAAWQLPHCQRRERFMQAFGAQAAGALETLLTQRGNAQRQLAGVADAFRESSRRVVHEVNNPLSIIKNYLSVLDSKLARQEPVAGELSILNEEIDRVGQLIGTLADPHAGAGAALDNARATDAARVVDEVVRLFRTSSFVPSSIEIVARMDGDSDIGGDPDVLKQILVNLLKNAVEALGPGGRIEIVNRGHVNRERQLYLDLSVSDNGPGLSREVLANLFAPVRSTKAAAPDGATRGIGLSIVHGLVKKLGGHIACRSSHAGTTFEILLPAFSGAGTALALPARALGSA